MIHKIITFSANNRLLTLFFVAVAVVASFWAMREIPLDALPDLSDTQVIVYSRWDQSPSIIEDQVTYPIVTSLLGAPAVKSVRGFSDYGYSYVYVIFEDGTDIYWARSRVLEYLARVQGNLPAGVKVELGSDATGVGWVYQYVLLDRSGQHDLADLRSYQDWTLRFLLQSVPGVAEVASVGGHVKQYQIHIDPNRLLSHNISLLEVLGAVRASNQEMGGRVLDFGGREYMIRGRGYVQGVADLENIGLGLSQKSRTPVLLKHVARIEVGPDMRRGLVDFNGEGDAVGGIVVMRHGENALNVIRRVKARIAEIKPSLPPGVEIKEVYDRSGLIERSLKTLLNTLTGEMVLVSLVVLLFLWHLPSATSVIITLPVSVIVAFLPMYFLGVTTNIMSLAGIAIAIGVLVDGTIVQVENMYRRVQAWMEAGEEAGTGKTFHEVRLGALKEVAPSIFFSLLVLSVSFLPVFTLVETEGRLFRPLAYTMTFAMGLSALLALTLDPAVRMLYSRYHPFVLRRPEGWALFSVHAEPVASKWNVRLFLMRAMETIRKKSLNIFYSQGFQNAINHALVGKYHREEEHPVSRWLFRIYEPACRFTLKRPRQTLGVAAALVVLTIPLFLRLGSEFMPPLNEGSILYMPTTLPGLSVGEAERILQTQNRILKSFPEVETVFGKAGRAETSTDPSPFSMIETTIMLKDESEWRKKERWYSFLPGFLHVFLQPIWSDTRTMEELTAEMNEAMQFPGWVNAYTMPIKARIDMLSTGIRTPVGIKIQGDDLKQIEELGVHLEHILKDIRGTRSVYAERVSAGSFIDFDLKRHELARHGLSVEDALMVLSAAMGGADLTTTIEGRERYSVHVRYGRSYRESLSELQRVLIPLPSGAQIPLGQLADLVIRSGPGMIRNENGLRSGYVYIDVSGRDIGSYVEEARAVVQEKLKRPPGYNIEWSGQYENMQRVRSRLAVILPLTILIIFLLLYFNTKSKFRALLVLSTLPLSIMGAVWILTILDYNLSIAVWVGMIALLGLDAETSIFMIMFLDLSYADWKDSGRLKTEDDLLECVIEGAVKRIRPKLMTVMTGFLGLMPILWSTGTGADVMKRIAAPMVGGLVTSFALELLIYPVVYYLYRKREMEEQMEAKHR